MADADPIDTRLVRRLAAILTETGLSEIELSTHQRFAGPFLLGASVVMTIAAVLFHVIPL